MQILSASDKAQHADKDAHRAAMRAWPKESKAHELVCEKPSTIKRQ